MTPTHTETRSRTETLQLRPAEAYRGTFAADDPKLVTGSPLPAGWEGLYFGFDIPLADLRPDGTPAVDGVLPTIDLPRRMYAGEDTEFLQPLRIGDQVTRTSRAGVVTEKTGRSGKLIFADIVSEYLVGDTVAVRSTWHDVFLGPPDPAAPAPAKKATGSATDDTVADATWSEDTVVDPRQLFRFSAITFNTHLVHYDRDWAQQREGLEDLLVHGPLTRILMMDAARRRHPDRTAGRLSVRSIAPAFVDRRLRITGRDDDLSTTIRMTDPDGMLLASAEIGWDEMPEERGR